MAYNLLSCSGFGTGSGYIGSMGCIQGRVGLVLLFFLVAIIRKWGGEEIGADYNFWLGLLFSIIPYFITVTIFGNFKIALVIGLVGALAGGYLGGMLFGGSEDGY